MLTPVKISIFFQRGRHVISTKEHATSHHTHSKTGDLKSDYWDPKREAKESKSWPTTDNEQEASASVVDSSEYSLTASFWLILLIDSVQGKANDAMPTVAPHAIAGFQPFQLSVVNTRSNKSRGTDERVRPVMWWKHQKRVDEKGVLNEY